MSLLEIFLELDIPTTENGNVFNATSLTDFPFAKIAISHDGYPVILISSVPDGTHLLQKNIRLTYIELSHNVECSVSESSSSKLLRFSVIVFMSTERLLQSYFLEIAEILLTKLTARTTQKELLTAFNSFVEVFRALSQPPSKTVQGLWSELFVIENSLDPIVLINYWHRIPEEKFDFNADIEKIEVKSSTSMNRIHIFSSDQLSPPDDKEVLIASVFTKQSSTGISIYGLIERLSNKNIKKELLDKLMTIVSRTLGNSLEQSLKIKYDYEIAKLSLRYYSHRVIFKIERINIPERVSEVKYKSDLTEIQAINPNHLNSNSLFRAL